jgi:23S rRNA (uracil1939-C5)-methyltransferase
MLAKNQKHTVKITDLNNLGFGVGRIEGRVVFVGGAVDGDTVEVQIIHVASGYAVARVLSFVERSPHREENSPCPAHACGGCAYRYVSEAHERALKENYIRSVFAKQGIAVTLAPMLSAGARYGYRNKAQYPVSAEKDGSLRIGFYAPKSHRVVDAIDCPLQDARFAPILRTCKAVFEEYHISAYDEQTGKGLLRHIYLRGDSAGRELLLTVVINGKKLPAEEEITARLRAAHPELTGILVNVNEENTNVICGSEFRTLWGKGYLTDTLAGVKLNIAPAAFYQVNHDAAALLYARARELACLSGDELVLDLYCGAGSIGLSMADAAREIIGIEVVPEAVACAKENAAQNGIQNASFYSGDATDARRLLAAAEKERGEPIHPDVVILDPPRKGCTEELLDYIAELRPARIVYISCNPDTLARDAKTLIANGYEMGEVTPADLFPCTGHVESVVCFARVF